jgi:hypothetical protein
MKIELEPDLGCCVETLAKREYEKGLREVLNGKESFELTQKMEVLRAFLEDADFKKLRGEYEPYLTQEKRVRFIMYLEEGKPKYNFEVIKEENGKR